MYQVHVFNIPLSIFRKFDIGVYTTLTSIDPLRVYILESEALFRSVPYLGCVT